MSLQVHDGFEHRTCSVARSLRLTETIFSFLLEAVKFLRSVAIVVSQFVRLDDKCLDFLSALPFSGFLYRINSYTQTPVNTVWFDAILAILLGCLVFAGSQAINAVFALSVTALYVAYSIPISARIVSKTNFKPGPFSLGIWVSKFSIIEVLIYLHFVMQSIPVAVLAVLFMVFMTIVFLFPMTPQTSVQQMNYTVVVLGGVLLLSLVWYYFPKYGGVYWFTGPVANINTRSQSLDKNSIDSEKGNNLPGKMA